MYEVNEIRKNYSVKVFDDGCMICDLELEGMDGQNDRILVYKYDKKDTKIGELQMTIRKLKELLPKDVSVLGIPSTSSVEIYEIID